MKTGKLEFNKNNDWHLYQYWEGISNTEITTRTDQF